ncbi:hypothetical protein NOE29_23710, partial [Escherichia coli]
MTGAFYFQGATDMPSCTSRLLPEGPFAAKWHLNRSQSGRLLPDPDGVIGCFHKNTLLASEG